MTIRLLYVAADPALTLDQQGGAGTHMRGTVEPLRRQGLEVVTAIGNPGGASWEPSIAQRPTPRLRRVVPRTARLFVRDLRLLSHGRAFERAELGPYDCVYERSAYLLDTGRKLARARRVPYVLETDGILVEARRAAYGAPLHRRAERLELAKIRSADLVVVMSEASRLEVAERYGLDPGHLLVKGLGVERELLDRPVPERPSIDVGWAGTFQPYHRVELLVEALRRLEPASAVLIGDGPGLGAIRGPASALGIELPGLLPRDEALEQLGGCRVLVIAESAETVYPVKLLEYAALGRPIVVPRRPAFDEFRGAGGNELLFGFRPGDPDDLARAISDALAAPDDRPAGLRELVRRGYTWDAVAERVAGAIRALVAKRRGAVR